MNKVLILTSDAGFGHRRAAEAISEALKIVCPDSLEPEILNPLHDPEIPDIIRTIESSYDEVVVDDPTLYQLAYAATDAPVVAQLMQNITTTAINKAMTSIVARHKPAAIITTYPAYIQAAIHAARNADHNVPVNVAVTDLVNVHSLWFHNEATMTFVPTGTVYKQALDLGIGKTNVQLTGLPVRPAFSEPYSKADLRKQLGWNTEQTTALVVGSARTRQTAGIAKLLDRSGLDLQVVVVAGGATDMYDELTSTEWSGNVHVYGMVNNMPDLMKASDFVVCKAGGLIVTEALASGLPMVLYEALPGQEVGNVKYVTENQAGDWSPGSIGALTTVYSWLAGSRTELEKRRSAAKQISRPRAAIDIAERICRQISVR